MRVCVCVCVCVCVWHGAAIARCMQGGEDEMEGGEVEMEKLRVLEAIVEMCVYVFTGCRNSAAHGGGL